MQQNSEVIPLHLKIASMLGITLLNDDAIKLMHLIEAVKSEAFNTGVTVERQRCVKICEDSATTNEVWWNSAMEHAAEQIKGESNATT